MLFNKRVSTAMETGELVLVVTEGVGEFVSTVVGDLAMVGAAVPGEAVTGLEVVGEVGDTVVGATETEGDKETVGVVGDLVTVGETVVGAAVVGAAELGDTVEGATVVGVGVLGADVDGTTVTIGDGATVITGEGAVVTLEGAGVVPGAVVTSQTGFGKLQVTPEFLHAGASKHTKVGAN